MKNNGFLENVNSSLMIKLGIGAIIIVCICGGLLLYFFVKLKF
jgi:hypothetical protein